MSGNVRENSRPQRTCACIRHIPPENIRLQIYNCIAFKGSFQISFQKMVLEAATVSQGKD